MAKEAIYTFGLITFAFFLHIKAQNSTFSISPPTIVPQHCESDGKIYNIGDEWRPSPFSVCKCVAPSAVACSLRLPCFDHQFNQRQPGDRWLESPTTNCTCTQHSLVLCQKLNEPICMDISGNLRKNGETWMNGSCVACECVNGTINCTGYDVNVTYGLYSVELLPTCEKCAVPLKTVETFSACKVYLELSKNGKLIECASGGLYIRDIHQCNGIAECPDESDEKGCENAVCKDEEGSLFLIKDENGWPLSDCMDCHCEAGLLTCSRALAINFPGYYHGLYVHNEKCAQPQCNVVKFVRENRDYCEGVEFTIDDGIYYKGQTWKYAGCDFYFPGAYDLQGVCPEMIKPVCYVYNGAICCASMCPGLGQIGNQLRGLLAGCPNGRQLASEAQLCRDSNHCLRNFYVQNCSSEITCQDEDSNQYFEGATWSVGKCIDCRCVQGTIYCSRKVVLASFLLFTQKLQVANEITFTEDCNQTECNVATYIKRNKEICHACRWNNKLYYEGDQWIENGVDFYCTSSDQKARPGCFVDNGRVLCTGAIPEIVERGAGSIPSLQTFATSMFLDISGIRQLSLISNDDLFLCESGDEIRSIGDRCNIRPNCGDRSDERNCDQYFCAPEKSLGFLWTRTPVDGEIIKHCSLINSNWTGTFGSKCTGDFGDTFWIHKNTCDCEKKTLVEHFTKKIADVNEGNFMNVSKEMAASAEASEFTNPKAFLDLFKDLFHAVTTMLTPLTHQNADTALEYCKHVIGTVLSSPIFGRTPSFCKPKLAGDRNSLAEKALEFLRQAPKNTTAYQTGANLGFHHVPDFRSEPNVKDNFEPVAPPLTIARNQLIVKLNTAPRIPPEVIKPTPKVSNKSINVTTGNETSPSKNVTTNKNLTKELTIQQIKDALRANNCTSVDFDEETGAFVYKQEESKESIRHEKIQSNMELVLLCISIATVILALILLTGLRLKTSERLFIHKNLLLTLGLGNLVYVLDKTLFASRPDHLALCSAVTVFQFFFHTALFTWMLVEGINLYIKLVKVFSTKRQYIAYLAIGWGIPAVIIGLMAAIRPSTFDMGRVQYEDVTCGSLNFTAEIQRTRCWINGSPWIYKGPILVILVANVMLFTILLRVIFGKIATKYSNDHLKITKRGLRSIVALLPLLGVTYVVGFFIEFHLALGYVFILLNSTQGVVFFIFHCVLDDQVHDATRKLIVKSRTDSKTRTTAASNPNTTPVMERNSRVHILHDSEVGKEMSGVIMKNGSQNETSF